jgi:hypothetical protein
MGNGQAARDFSISRDEWDSLAEIEAILNIVHQYTTVVQTEKRPMAAFSYELRRKMVADLRAPYLAVVDLDQITADTTQSALPRRQVSRLNMSAIGQTCWLRACLEAERRFCGSKATDHTNPERGPVLVAKYNELPMLMDPRTVASATGVFTSSTPPRTPPIR